MGEVIVSMKDIVKTFPGVKALDHVNFELRSGEVMALLGENGAGKSTLMKILSGVYTKDSGTMTIFGTEYENLTPKQAQAVGVAIIHQELNMCRHLSVAENMFLGREKVNGIVLNDREMEAEAAKILGDLKIDIDPRQTVGDLPVSKQQMVEIAKALSVNARILIMDEPTASLNETDSKALLDLMLELKKKGMTSIIISHKLNEISYVADKITVIRDGSTIETLVKGKDDITENRIIKGMVGREIADRFPKREPHIGEIRMEVKDWTVHHPLYSDRKVVDNVNLNVRKGEVVGISGLMGAGRTELAMSLFGKSYGSNISGELYINGQKVNLSSVQEAIKNRLAYVTEDRKGNGLILSNPIKINTTLANLDAVSSHTVIDKDKEYNVAVDYKKKLNTKCPTVEQNVGNLSGGNQQKVVIGHALATNPKLIILDEPTRGIDAGARTDVYNIIKGLSKKGLAVLLISSDMEEIIELSDRAVTIHQGRLNCEFDRADINQENLTKASFGVIGKEKES